METPQTPKIPAFDGRRFLGLLPAFQQNPRLTMVEVWRACGDLGRFRLGPLPVVQVNTPVLAGEVLRDETSFRRGYLVEQALTSLIGDVLTTHDLEKHVQPDALSSVLQRVPFQVMVQRRNTRPTDDLVPASARAECA
jgi:hypothetical protein